MSGVNPPAKICSMFALKVKICRRVEDVQVNSGNDGIS